MRIIPSVPNWCKYSKKFSHIAHHSFLCMNCQNWTIMRRISHSTLATTVAIGILALGVGAVTVTSNLQTAQAEPKNCVPYGQLVSSEAQNPNNEPGYGDEIVPLAQEDGSFGQEYRQPGERPPGQSTCGNSNVAK